MDAGKRPHPTTSLSCLRATRRRPASRVSSLPRSTDKCDMRTGMLAYLISSGCYDRPFFCDFETEYLNPSTKKVTKVS